MSAWSDFLNLLSSIDSIIVLVPDVPALVPSKLSSQLVSSFPHPLKERREGGRRDGALCLSVYVNIANCGSSVILLQFQTLCSASTQIC